MTPDTPRDARDLPLEGITVLDFTRVLSGPYCTRMLADLGANVLKIERPGEGDEVRVVGVQFDPNRSDQSAYYARLNAGKKSLGIDLSRPECRDIVLDLARRADVVVENFSPGVIGRLGFGYDVLSAVRPGLVYCSISGFGQTGPLKSMQAYAHLVNAFSGMMELERGGENPPRAANLQAADVLAGLNACSAVLAALLRQTRSGRGAYIDVSMLECLICADDINFISLLNGGIAERRPRPGMLVEAVGDHHLALQLGGTPQVWARMATLMGRPELIDDPRFATAPARRLNWEALRQLIADWMNRMGDVDAAVAELAKVRVPHAPMMTPEEIVAHPHLAQRQAFPSMPHPAGGTVRITSSPFHLDAAPVAPAGPPPHLIGEHTRDVLTAFLGYSSERVDALFAQGIVAEG